VFSANDGTYGQELWRSDGTSATTVLVKNIAPINLDSRPNWFVKLGTKVLFIADDDLHGAELWKTDGTGTGTKFVFDINQLSPP
jgi:ELWxxDGT repeat protein